MTEFQKFRSLLMQRLDPTRELSDGEILEVIDEMILSRSQDRDGVGLGLYIVKTILNNHGEDIAVTSRQGVTDFVFTLALKPESRKGESKKQ